MLIYILFAFFIAIALPQSDILVLHKQRLESYPGALCNDGTPAIYYIPGVHRGSDVVIYLEVSLHLQGQVQCVF